MRTVDRAPTFVAVSSVLASLWSELTEFKPVISVALCIFWSYDLDSSGAGARPWHFHKEQWDSKLSETGQRHMDVGGTELSMSRIIRTAVNWICEGFLEDSEVLKIA